MTSEEYLDSLLQSLEGDDTIETESAENTSVKQIFTDVDDYVPKENLSSLEDEIFREEDASAEDGEDEEAWKSSLDELLAAADASELFSEEGTEDSLSVDLSEDMDVTQYIDNMEETDDSLAEINELLKKSDNNEAVPEDMMALFGNLQEHEADNTLEEGDTKNEKTAKEKKKFQFPGRKKREVKEKKPKKTGRQKKQEKAEEQEVTETDIEVNSEINIEENVAEASTDEWGALAGFAEEAKEAVPEKVSEKEPKSKGFLHRLFEMLTAEAEEEQSLDGLSENDEILKDLEAEDKKKTGKKEKKKKEKKPKKEKKEKGKSSKETKKAAEGEEGEAGEQQKPKKEKKKKEPEEGVRQKPGKRLSKSIFAVIIAFCATLIAAIVSISILLSDYADKKKARVAFYVGDYKEAYILLYDKNLGDSDALILERVRVILELERNVEVYEFYQKAGKEAEAIDALLEGVRNYEELAEIHEFGSAKELELIYQEILQLLADRYGISEEEAKELNSYDPDTYTRKVYGIVRGEEFRTDSDEEKPKEVQDILPEEEGIIELETENEGA